MRNLTPILLLAGTLALAITGQALAAPVQDLDRIVAVVDDDVIMASELDREIARLTQKARLAGQAMPPDSVVREKTLERLVLLKLQLAAAERAGINITPEALDRAISNIAKRNKLSVEQMRDALAAEGIDFDRYREQLKTDLTLSQLRNREVLSRIRITTDEIDDYLGSQDDPAGRQAVLLRHILIAVPKDADQTQVERARAKAESLLDRLREGADFAALAEAESDGRQAANGGELGWMRSNQVPSLFAEAVGQLGRGEVAGPLKSGSGYHLVQLADFKGGERAVINQTRVRHILVTPNELVSDNEARIRLEQLRERISGGDDFATLARSHSDDKGSAIKGGELGWVSPGDLVPPFEEAMNQMAVNELSQPVRSRFGWHLIQVLERRQHDATDEVRRNKARQALREQKAAEATRLYLRQLRNEAYVELRNDDF
jgi:peptidyl-prolyl cis-trans isomerase SurA